jgi:hypothetical protein
MGDDRAASCATETRRPVAIENISVSDNAYKLSLAASLDAAARQRAADGDQLQGKGLPCKITKIISSNLVEVEFDIKGPFTLPRTKVPVSSPEYARIPYQVGDRGVAISLDYYQGGVSDLGGGTADYVQRANLTNLRFEGIGRKQLPGNVDQNAHVLYGKNGVVLHDLDSDGNKHSVVTITPEKIIIDVSQSSGKTVEIKGTTSVTFDGDLRVKGNITAGYGSTGVSLLNHTHAQPADSHGDTEQETIKPTAGH